MSAMAIENFNRLLG